MCIRSLIATCSGAGAARCGDPSGPGRPRIEPAAATIEFSRSIFLAAGFISYALKSLISLGGWAAPQRLAPGSASGTLSTAVIW